MIVIILGVDGDEIVNGEGIYVFVNGKDMVVEFMFCC